MSSKFYNKLFEYCENDKYQKFKELLDNDQFIDVNFQEGLLNSLLHCICFQKSKNCCYVLLNHPKYKNIINPNLINKYNETPLHFACQENSINCFELLLKYEGKIKLNFNIQDIHGKTSLHYILSKDFVNCLKLLLNYDKIDFNIKDNVDNTPLHYATIYIFSQCLKFLSKNQKLFSLFDPNIKNFIGNTPLHSACSNNSKLNCYSLLSHTNINVDIKNNDNKLPDDLTDDINIKNLIKNKREKMLER